MGWSDDPNGKGCGAHKRASPRDQLERRNASSDGKVPFALSLSKGARPQTKRLCLALRQAQGERCARHPGPTAPAEIRKTFRIRTETDRASDRYHRNDPCRCDADRETGTD